RLSRGRLLRRRLCEGLARQHEQSRNGEYVGALHVVSPAATRYTEIDARWRAPCDRTASRSANRGSDGRPVMGGPAGSSDVPQRKTRWPYFVRINRGTRFATEAGVVRSNSANGRNPACCC